MPRFDEGESLTKFEYNDLLMAGSPDNFSKILAQDFFAESITYANLTTLVNNSECVQGKWYKITNATSASFNLLVQAITSNKISCEAKDPLYPNDKVMYNFSSNVITWRWDTVNDISAGADWRNSNDIQIGTGCSHIEIGSECEVTIGNDCTEIKIGNSCSGIILPSNTYLINIYSNQNGLSTLQMSIVDCTFESLSNVDYTSATKIYEGGSKRIVNGTDDDRYIITYSASGIDVSLANA